MTEVPTTENLPARTVKLSLLLERHPLQECKTVDDLINTCNSVIKVYNRTALYTAYFLGWAFDPKTLDEKYPGMTVEKLGKALGISRATAFRYRALTNILTPKEVDELGHIPYTCILQFPEIEKKFGAEDLAQLKFRLKTNDFNGVKGTRAFDKELERMAQERLELGSCAPDLSEPIDAEVVDDHEVVNPCETVELTPDTEDLLGDEPNAVDAILKDRAKSASSKLPSEQKGRVSNSERKAQAEIALAQAKRDLQKMRDAYARLNTDFLDRMHRVWQQEDQLSIPMHTIYKVLSGPFAA